MISGSNHVDGKSPPVVANHMGLNGPPYSNFFSGLDTWVEIVHAKFLSILNLLAQTMLYGALRMLRMRDVRWNLSAILPLGWHLGRIFHDGWIAS